MSYRSFLPLLLLFIPLVAMQITEEVNWSLFDFLVMGGMLLFVGIGLDFINRKNRTLAKKLIYTIALVLIFLVIWAELSVGIFGTPFAGS
ncbi:hypothetical protein [Namhaeicola litoreus]|uniref:Uncharacterized protein n=1 Tax=Namhaeicola litoreus TaxID=1052145 RepID=A0ABW3Y0R8_9FLAO